LKYFTNHKQKCYYKQVKHKGNKVKNNIKKAFTLAEVLITLVIIGVVAAITVPTIHNNSIQKQTITQLRKVHSELAQAVTMSSIKYGYPDTWDYELNHYNFFKKYLFPYIQISQEKVGNVKKLTKYYELSGREEKSLYVMQTNSQVVNLASGNQVFIGEISGIINTPNRRCYMFDVNGYRKPNKIGRDLYMFCIDSKRGVLPFSAENNEGQSITLTREQLKKGNTWSCNKNSVGLFCAALIMMDGWQMKDDYPW